ncbi:hypothetical protein SAMN05660845_0654 [Flavobacterium swingsii]|jgi:hypothetical protein|uniref:Uncharacterized protein n=1 Tax=Flavobacterium swingsii TaxID=498292 RepID=A0A1I0WBR4_9FLAO|nr:hypothetical protein [Flavobacterium swingsii]SFA85718.1 hypothetical protein SAMN05660845_0654 [Flavobacterium swingsii]
MKNYRLYFITFFAICFSVFVSIPYLKSNLSDYDKKTKIYNSFEIDTLVRNRLFRTSYDRTLILKMSDGTKWSVSKVFSKYFDELKDSKNIGKKYTLYVSSETDESPSQIEIENKIVYSIKSVSYYNYFIIIATLILVYFSYQEMKNTRKMKTEKSKDKTRR